MWRITNSIVQRVQTGTNRYIQTTTSHTFLLVRRFLHSHIELPSTGTVLSSSSTAASTTKHTHKSTISIPTLQFRRIDNYNKKNSSTMDECSHSHMPVGDKLCTDETYQLKDVGHQPQPRPEAVKFSKIVFLGTGSAIPSPGRRNTSAVAVALNNASTILLDCGEATQHQLMRCSSVRFNTISSILITHLHGDHCFGLFGLLCTVASQGRTEPVLIVGPRGLRNMVVTVLGSAGGFGGFEMQFLELEHEQAYPDLGLISSGVHLSAYPLKHRIASFGYVLKEEMKPGALDVNLAKQQGAQGKQLGQLKEGKDVQLPDGRVIKSSDCVGAPMKARKIALLQDTYNSDSALAALEDVDLLIHECTYSSGMYTKAIDHGHSTSTMLGEYGARCNAQMIMMTHFSNRYETREQTRINAPKREAEAKAAAEKKAAADAKQAASVATVEAGVQSLSVASSPAAITLAVASSSSSSDPSTPAIAAPVESDVLTLDELVAEATAAYVATHPTGTAPKGGIHAAEDFLVVESVREQFTIQSKKDRVAADYELVGLQQNQEEAAAATTANAKTKNSKASSSSTTAAAADVTSSSVVPETSK